MHNNYNNSLSNNNNNKIQRYTSNPAIQLVGSIVQLEESVKTFVSTESAKSRITNAEYTAWLEYENLRG